MDIYVDHFKRYVYIYIYLYICIHHVYIHIPTTNTYTVHTLGNSCPLFMIHVLFHCFIDLSIFHCIGLISINGFLLIHSFISNHLNTGMHVS